MRTAVKWCLLLLNSLAFLGCATTAEDFQKMSLTERQAAVCYGSDAFEQRKERLSYYEEEIPKRQRILSRGYRIHTSCRQVAVEQPKNCVSTKTSMGKSACAGMQPLKTYKNECTDTPVSIDAQYEQQELDEYHRTYSALSLSHSELTQKCFSRVADMPPQAAYIYYSEDMEPR